MNATASCIILRSLSLLSIFHYLFIMSSLVHVPNQSTSARQNTFQYEAPFTPLYSLFLDWFGFIKNFTCLPYIFKPYRTVQPLPLISIPVSDKVLNYRDAFFSIIIALLESLFVLAIAPTLLFIPGWKSIPIIFIPCSLIYLIQTPSWGPNTVKSQVKDSKWKDKGGEKWFFINGIGCTRRGLQKTCDRLSATFQRPFIGIHNPT